MSWFEEKIIGKDWVMNENLKKEIDERIEAFKQEIYAKIEGNRFPDKLPETGLKSQVTYSSYNTDQANRKLLILKAISELIDWESQVGSGDWVIDADKCTTVDILEVSRRGRFQAEKPGFASKEAAQHVFDRLSDNCKAYLRGEFSG
jgi:hypothetical protein